MKTIRRILVAVDFSEVTPKVWEYAKLLGENLGADLHLVYVAPSLDQYTALKVPPVELENMAGSIMSRARERMDEFLAANRAKARVTGRVVLGYAPEAIVQAGKDAGADLIVMGTHGRKGMDRILFGSVADKVLKTAPSPVLTIRPDPRG